MSGLNHGNQNEQPFAPKFDVIVQILLWTSRYLMEYYGSLETDDKCPKPIILERREDVSNNDNNGAQRYHNSTT